MTVKDIGWFDKIWEKHLATIVSLPEFCYAVNFCFRRLQTSTIISRLIQLFLQSNDLSKCYGVHIRHTDNVSQYKVWAETLDEFNASYISTLDGFKSFIADALAENSSRSIFLATDDRSVKRDIKGLFPGRIITYPKRFNNELPGILSWKRFRPKPKVQRASSVQEALVEMMLLSKCSCIAGTYFSSFSKMSSFFSHDSTEYFEVRGNCYENSTFVEKLRCKPAR